MESPNITDIVYGAELPALDDPSETWFEATKLARSTVWWDSMGVFMLEGSSWLQKATVRAGKRLEHRPGVELVERTPLPHSFDDLLSKRRSSDSQDPSATISSEDLLAIVHAAYGVNGECAPGLPGRTVPSGGALFPLDLYVAIARVDGMEPGTYHVDPQRMRFSFLTESGVQDIAAATVQPEIFETSAAILIVAASFWRSRFKYGHRAVRFVLFEAGHLVQNALLAATALGLSHLPIGGFYDDEVAAIIGVDGVNEAPLYLMSVGVPSNTAP